MNKFSKVSQKRLDTCDLRLQALFSIVLVYDDCSILSGHRGKEEQNDLFERGMSKLMYPNSKHNEYPSKAVDVMRWPIDWEDWEGMRDFANKVKAVAKALGVNVVWGGDWKSFPDAAHWELED